MKMYRTLLPLALLFVVVATVNAFTVPTLPNDNLIDFDSAWMRGDEFPRKIAGYGRWVDETGNRALSQGKKNPAPDGETGTMMQWDSSVRTAAPLMPGQDAYVYLLVDAPLPHSVLNFSYYSVGRGGADIDVEVFGCDASGQGCVSLWQPIGTDYQHSRFRPQQSPLAQHALAGDGYPVYKIRQHCTYSSGRAGCKTTGYYFSVDD